MIMGPNVFGVEEANRYFKAIPTQAQFEALAYVPFSEATLEECRSSHILAAVFPLSIMDIRDNKARPNLVNLSSVASQPFTMVRGKHEALWYLIRKSPAPNSLGKDWRAQQCNLATPRARVMVYAITGYFLMRSEALFSNTYVRCWDLTEGAEWIVVGGFKNGQLIVRPDRGLSDSFIGLAEQRSSTPKSLSSIVR